MTPVRRNSTEFNSIKKVLKNYSKKKERKKLIHLYALKPGEDLDDKVLINTLKKDSEVLYSMNYESILMYLDDLSKKLFRDGEKPFYYFKSSAKSDWLEFPFEFTGILKKQLFPLTRVH
jgi:hypothetical protein